MIKKLPLILVAVAALTQLALAPQHIDAAIAVPATDVGFYLFVSVLVGLVTLFSVGGVLEAKRDKKIMYFAMTVLTVVIQSVYMYKMLAEVGDTVPMGKIIISMIIMSITMIMYIVGSVVVFIQLNKETSNVKPATT